MRLTIGIDEAGRGPLAGPVAVGVFAVTSRFDMHTLKGIRDSKVMTPSERDEWYERLTTVPHMSWAVAMSTADTIDRYGIVPAISRALRRALARVATEPGRTSILLDGGLKAPRTYAAQQTIIRGDASEPLIAAAAVLAKVTRDRKMCSYARRYPQYGFERHKGYGTASHRYCIARYGLCSIHRTTFCHMC